MPIPLNKLIDVNEGRYKIARAAMQLIGELSLGHPDFDPGEKIAAFTLGKVLNGEVKYKFHHEIELELEAKKEKEKQKE